MIVVDGAGIIFERRQFSVCVQTTAQLEHICRSFCVPTRLLIPHPLEADRPAELMRQKGSFEARIVGRRTAVDLGSVHVDHPYTLTGHVEELCDTIAEAVSL